MNNKQDEIKHLKYLHMEYKKKYNSKKQTIEEENKTISENNSIMKQTDILNSNPNSKYNNTTSRQEKNDENDESSKANKNQTSNNTMNSISEHIIREKENNNKIFSRKVFPLHNINLPIEKKEINDDDQNNNIDINKEMTIDMNNKGNKTIKNEEKIKISLNIDKNILKRRGSEFIFDSKIKNKLLYEFKQNLDEKIYELRKKLNLTNLNTEVDQVLEDEQSGRKNVNESNIIKKDNHLSKIVDKNNLENSKNFKKKTISMLESFEFNSVNMDQSSIGPTIQVNNNTLTTINIQKISFDKFLSINQTSLKKSPYLIMLSYMNTKDIFQLFQTNKKIHELFLKVLKIEINTYISNKFRKITKNLFDNYSFYICLEKNLLSRELKINLILKAKIISESLVKKSLNIQYFAFYPCDENQYVQNTFLLDIKNPPLYYWAMKESTNFNQDELNKAYFMNVMQYAIGDYIEFTLNIFTEKGIMDIRKLVWNKITVFKTPDEDFLYYSNENILKREIVDFDVSRYCEMELCKGKWNDIILLDDSDMYIGELKNKFKKNFHIMNILFDNVGYLIFKFYLEGIIPGVIGPDDEIGMKIKVLDYNEKKSNEAKKII